MYNEQISPRVKGGGELKYVYYQDVVLKTEKIRVTSPRRWGGRKLHPGFWIIPPRLFENPTQD